MVVWMHWNIALFLLAMIFISSAGLFSVFVAGRIVALLEFVIRWGGYYGLIWAGVLSLLLVALVLCIRRAVYRLVTAHVDVDFVLLSFYLMFLAGCARIIAFLASELVV